MIFLADCGLLKVRRSSGLPWRGAGQKAGRRAGRRKDDADMGKNRLSGGISALTLHLFAMGCMLCDHLWATLLPQWGWLNWVGRLAFPIFAFMAAEGCHHTRSLKKYLLRLTVFALLSEIPFDLMYGGRAFYPVHQNVIWTLLLGLLGAAAVEKIRKRGKWWLTALVFLLAAGTGYILGTLLMVDYYGPGVLTVLLFDLFRGRKWRHLLGQAAGLYWVNVVLLGGMMVPVHIGGMELEISQQGTALLALIPIWLYRGRQGPHSRAIQYACYAFYPLHMLILTAVLRVMEQLA